MVVTELQGERIAKDVVAKMRAQEILDKRPRNFSWQVFVGSLAVGIGCGAAMITLVGFNLQIVIGAVGLAMFALLITTFKECLSLRRRLDAAIVLLQQHEAGASAQRSNHALHTATNERRQGNPACGSPSSSAT